MPSEAHRKHTPGPWKADPVSWGGRHRISGNHVPVAEVLSYEDARLIAAAPKMLVALQMAYSLLAKEFREANPETGEYISEQARPTWLAICGALGESGGDRS